MEEVQILVVHVRGQEDRKAFIQRQLDKLGYPYTYILDGNVEDLTPEILDRYFVDNGCNQPMHGQFPRTSCTMKHLLATQYILDHQLEGALIIEDDIYFYKPFKELFQKSLKEYREKYSNIPIIANYEESSLLLVPRSQRVKGQILYPASRDRYAGCYFLNRLAAQAIMDYVNQHKADLISDRLHNKLIELGFLKSFWSYPCLVNQCSADGSMPTMIPTKPRPMKRLKWLYKRFYKHLLYYFR